MICNNCGCELADNATFCSKCGKKLKNKNIYIALVLTFILTGLGSIYAGNTKKGLTLLILRVLFAAWAFFQIYSAFYPFWFGFTDFMKYITMFKLPTEIPVRI